MQIELKIPEVGESITEVQIGEWLKAEGDTVNADEAVAVIDSEKTTFELSAPEGGRLAHILHKAGETVPVGEVVAQIEADGQQSGGTAPVEPKAKAVPPIESKPPTARAAKEREQPPKAPPKPEPTPRDPKEPAQKTPSAATEAPAPQEEKKPHSEPKRAEPPRPDEPEGRAASTHEREIEVVPMTMLRRTVARRLVEAQQTMAMLTTFNEVDMAAVQALRKEHGEAFEKRYGTKLGFMSFFVKAAIDALKQFPQLNAEIRGSEVAYHNYFDIGVAVATAQGLVVPVLRDAERLSFAELEKAVAALSQRARDGKLKPQDLEAGTFTITNGGVFGSLLSTPIINPPQTGILGMHTIQERPVALGGQVVIRPMMYVALTYDHRLVDGREAVLFLRRIKEAIENPARMLIEI